MMLADYLAQFLAVQGTSRVFGLPGGETVTVIDALRRAGINFVLFHHETQAGYAADASGQLTGKPGVCLSTVGPGAVNLSAAAAAATLERSPMIAITAEIETSWQDNVSHMKVDLEALFRPVCKGSFRLQPETAAETLNLAWSLSQEPPRGAVHLSIAPDMATGEVNSVPKEAPPVKVKPANSETIRPVTDLVKSSRDLFILAGLGVEAAMAQVELLALAEHWHAPVAVTPKAKGHFPESHSLFAGCFTAYGDKPLRRALADSDLIVGVGLDSVDFVTSTWEFETPLVTLSEVEGDDPALRPVAAAVGNLKGMLRLLVSQTPQMRKEKDPKIARLAGLREDISSRLVEPQRAIQPGTLHLHELISALQRALPENGAVTLDVGAFKLVFLQQWRTDLPKSLFVANGLSAMGYAVPAALAIKLAQPSRPVVAVAGDGALLMYAGELATIARSGRPMVILVVVDQALSLIRLKQLRQEVAICGTEFVATDYEALAGAFGLDYLLLNGSDDLAAMLEDAVCRTRPVLVEARVDRTEYERFR